MSVLDFYVSKDGYLVNDHASVIEQSSLTESCDYHTSMGLTASWLENVRALAKEVYSLYDVDMRPDNIEEFEVLNSKLNYLSSKIASQCAIDNALFSSVEQISQSFMRNSLEPHFIRISANMRKISDAVNKTLPCQTIQSKVFSRGCEIDSVLTALRSETNSGLSERIVDIPELLHTRDGLIAEKFGDFKSFREVFSYIIGIDSQDIDIFETYEHDVDFARLMDDIKTNFVSYASKYEEPRSDKICYKPYKAVSRAMLKNLEEVYENGRITDVVYERLYNMAATVINLFNDYWISTYPILASAVNKISEKEYIDRCLVIIADMLKPAQPVAYEENTDNTAE